MPPPPPLNPGVSWFQRRGQLTLTISCAAAEGEPALDVSAEELTLTWGVYALRACFLKPVAEGSASWRKVGSAGGKLELVVRKAVCGPHWPAVFTGGKRANVKPDWDRWIEEEEEPEEAPPKAVPAIAAGADAQALADSLEARFVVDLGSLDDEGRLERWRSLTTPERMLTMALMWNAMSGDSRLASVRRLIELLRAAGGPLAALDRIIKGGAGVLRALDTSIYGGERHAAAWVRAFGDKHAEQQIELMAELFMHLPADEQRLVVGSLS